MEMAGPSHVELASVPPEQILVPLSAVTNSPSRTSTLSQCKRIRRKSSLIRCIDSSEEIPSSHESIFYAERFSNTNSEDSDPELWAKGSPGPVDGPNTSSNLMENNKDMKGQLLPPIVGSTPILYGHGTALTTIVEQKSTTTMSTKVSSADPGSASELSLARTPTPNLLGHRNSSDLLSTVILHPPRKRRSFSADDLLLIKRSYHEACVMIERTTCNSLQLHNVYAEPHMPILPPIERPSTPPGMPSWKAAQNAPAHHARRPREWDLRGTQSRLQRFLGIGLSSSEFSSRIPVPLALQHSNQSRQVERSTSSPLTTRIAPRFRPIRSGHGTGPLEMHPFHHAERRDVKSGETSAMSQVQIPNHNMPSQAGAPQRRSKTEAKGKRRRYVQPHFMPAVARDRQISKPATFGSRVIARERQGVPLQCPHSQGRQASLQSLNQPSEAIISDRDCLMVNYALLPSNEPEEDSTRQSAPANPIVVEPQSEVTTFLIESPTAEPVMTGAITSLASRALPSTKNTPPVQKCWKCRVSTFVSPLDDIWETSTSWCCWVFCGVDLHDEGEAENCGHRNRARSSNGSGSLRPRRVVLDGMPAMLY